MPNIKISYTTWSVPDYRKGETSEDSQIKKVEIESDTTHIDRISVNMDEQDVIIALKVIQSVIRAAICKEAERIDKRS